MGQTNFQYIVHIFFKHKIGFCIEQLFYWTENISAPFHDHCENLMMSNGLPGEFDNGLLEGRASRRNELILLSKTLVDNSTIILIVANNRLR